MRFSIAAASGWLGQIEPSGNTTYGSEPSSGNATLNRAGLEDELGIVPT